MVNRIFSTILIVLYLLLNPLAAFAQTPTPFGVGQTSTPSAITPQQPTTYSLPSNISPTSPIFTDLLVNNIFHSFSCLAVGQSLIGQPCVTYQITKNAQGAIQTIPVLSKANLSGGALGATAHTIGLLYQNPPVRTADYLASVGEGLGITKEAHAQVVGSGSRVLSPILTLWQVSRNVAYVIMIIIFIIIGLMVMFRNRINPQTVITAQAALPGLVIGLILVTFSFFLAGLISDIAFIGTNIVGYYFQAAQAGGDLNQNLTQLTATHNALSVFSKFIGIIERNDIQQIINIVFNNVSPGVQDFMRFVAGIAAFQFGSQVGHAVPIVGDLAAIVTGVTATLLTAAATPFVLGQVASYIAMAILIYTMIKLLLKLITVYLTIIFLTISAPFQFLFASLPGRQGIATSWIMSILSNVLVFPAVMAVFYFAAFLLGRPQEVTTLFNISSTPTITGNYNFPLLGGLDLSFLKSLMAFGALAATPAIPDIIARTMGTVSQAGQILGQEITGGVRSGQGYYGQVQQQTVGAAQSIGESYQRFRGRPPGWGPATRVDAILGGRLPGWLKPRT